MAFNVKHNVNRHEVFKLLSQVFLDSFQLGVVLNVKHANFFRSSKS